VTHETRVTKKHVMQPNRTADGVANYCIALPENPAPFPH
jgi:hypothetical protein